MGAVYTCDVHGSVSSDKACGTEGVVKLALADSKLIFHLDVHIRLNDAVLVLQDLAAGHVAIIIVA